MTGIRYSIDIRDSVSEELSELLARIGDRRPLFKLAGAVLLEGAQQRFHDEQAPDGSKWQHLSLSTIRARSKGSSAIRMLRDRGLLYGSLSYQFDNDELRVGSSHPHAATHQLGATIKIPGRQQKIYRIKNANGQIGRRFAKKEKANHITEATVPARTITIPARPFLGVSDLDRERIEEGAVGWLMG